MGKKNILRELQMQIFFFRQKKEETESVNLKKKYT